MGSCGLYLWWNGDDIAEWGYDDGKGYAYSNTKNNRKLLDPITYDDNGEVIPLSQRFNKGNPDIRYSIRTDGNGMFAYTPDRAVPSKEGFTFERVNETAGSEFNGASGVVCVPGEDLKDSLSWSKEQWRKYMAEKNITGMHHVPALNAEVEVRSNLPKRLKGHTAFEEKMNLISVVPQMLNDAVLIQQERKGELNSYILAAKVRYGEGENAKRFITGIVIRQDNQGKLYYDHELTEIEKAAEPQNRGHNPADSTASVNNVIQNVLFASGFDKKSENNTRFSLGEVDARTKNLITMMQPIAGMVLEYEGAWYAKQMRDKYNVHLDETEARVIAIEAIRQNQADARIYSLIVKIFISGAKKSRALCIPPPARLPGFNARRTWTISRKVWINYSRNMRKSSRY